jgi:putative endonuclease
MLHGTVRRPRGNTRERGNRGEELVCERLVARGMRIVARNVTEKFAELDIVAEDGDTLVFIEVRTRRDDALGHPAETVTEEKRRKIRRAAEAYLVKRRVPPRPVRFDVATIIWSTMQYDYFENAF